MKYYEKFKIHIKTTLKNWKTWSSNMNSIKIRKMKNVLKFPTTLTATKGKIIFLMFLSEFLQF